MSNDKVITILLTTAGYAVVAHGEILETKDPKKFSVLEMHKQYVKEYGKSGYTFQLITKGVHDIQDAVSIVKRYLSSETIHYETLTASHFDEPVIPEVKEPLLIKSVPNNNNKLIILKTNTMNNQEKVTTGDRVRATSIVGIQTIAGPIHFILQSSADLVAYSEAVAIKKIGRFDMSTQEIANRRRENTAKLQVQAMNAPRNIKTASKGLQASIARMVKRDKGNSNTTTVKV